MTTENDGNTQEASSLHSLVSCVGDGGPNGGCGHRGGKSGYQCPKCGGMLLSSASIAEAIRLATAWAKEEAANVKLSDRHE